MPASVTEAVTARLPKGSTYYFLNRPRSHSRSARRAIPCGQVAHYTSSGTEATFYAPHRARTEARGIEFEAHGTACTTTVCGHCAGASRIAACGPDSVGVPPRAARRCSSPFNEQRARSMVSATRTGSPQ
jgi:glutamate-1-semialdehyde aminotransferase